MRPDYWRGNARRVRPDSARARNAGWPREPYDVPMSLELGLGTYGDIAAAPDGTPLHPAVVIRELMAEGELADRLGVDFFGIGEHHRDDYAASAPEMILAGLAGRTERIKLGSAATVLSSDDPVRVFERFATLDAISQGRAELTLGRGSFTESFPLFGYDLDRYEELFAEKLDLLVTLLKEERPARWTGNFRPMLDAVVQPRTERGHLPAWVGVSGTPASVERAARYGLPVALIVIGGPLHRFAGVVDHYRRALARDDRPELPVGLLVSGHVAATDEQALEEYTPHFLPYMNRLARERGWSPMTEERARNAAGVHGGVFCGSPDTVARKIADAARLLGLSRFQLRYSMGELPHERRMESIRLYAQEVAPRVQEMLAPAA